MGDRPGATILKVVRPTGDLITTDYHVYDSEVLISMCSMLMLGGSGGMPPQENFEKYML